MSYRSWAFHIDYPLGWDEIPKTFQRFVQEGNSATLDIFCYGYEDTGSSLNCPVDRAYPPEGSDDRDIVGFWADGVKIPLSQAELSTLNDFLYDYVHGINLREYSHDYQD